MKTFPLKLTDELHAQIKDKAYEAKNNIHAYILDCIAWMNVCSCKVEVSEYGFVHPTHGTLQMEANVKPEGEFVEPPKEAKELPTMSHDNCLHSPHYKVCEECVIGFLKNGKTEGHRPEHIKEPTNSQDCSCAQLNSDGALDSVYHCSICKPKEPTQLEDKPVVAESFPVKVVRKPKQLKNPRETKHSQRCPCFMCKPPKKK